MLQVEFPPMMLALPEEIAVRLRRLAERRGESVEVAAIGAIERYLEWLEGLDAFDRGAVEALHEYNTTGMHVTAAEADAWLAELENGNDVEPPECHT